MKVSVVTQTQSFLKNRIFLDNHCIEGVHRGNSHWVRPYQILFKQAQAAGISLCTYDLLAPENSDAVLFLDPPQNPRILRDLMHHSPGIKRILLTVESPLVRPENYFLSTRKLFDRVISHDCYRLPVEFSLPAESLPKFQERGTICLINAYQLHSSWKQIRNYLSLIKKGWPLSIQDSWNLLKRRELYSERAKWAQEMKVDVFGKDWPERFNPRGPFQANKMELLSRYRFTLAFENVENDVGYLSEKLIEPLFSGTIPIYWGERNFHKYIPRELVIDASTFPTIQSCFEKVSNMSQGEWEIRHRKIISFVQRGGLSEFSGEAFAANILTILKNAVSD